jgi:hypothetical protein
MSADVATPIDPSEASATNTNKRANIESLLWPSILRF